MTPHEDESWRRQMRNLKDIFHNTTRRSGKAKKEKDFFLFQKNVRHEGEF